MSSKGVGVLLTFGAKNGLAGHRVCERIDRTHIGRDRIALRLFSLPINDAIIEDLRGRERDGLIVLPPPPRLRPGDRVRITAGPLLGRLAIFAGMKPHQRVAVLLTFLGSERRVALGRHDILRVT